MRSTCVSILGRRAWAWRGPAASSSFLNPASAAMSSMQRATCIVYLQAVPTHARLYPEHARTSVPDRAHERVGGREVSAQLRALLATFLSRSDSDLGSDLRRPDSNASYLLVVREGLRDTVTSRCRDPRWSYRCIVLDPRMWCTTSSLKLLWSSAATHGHVILHYALDANDLSPLRLLC